MLTRLCLLTLTMAIKYIFPASQMQPGGSGLPGRSGFPLNPAFRRSGFSPVVPVIIKINLKMRSGANILPTLPFCQNRILNLAITSENGNKFFSQKRHFQITNKLPSPRSKNTTCNICHLL
jgi:hypothetical protein